MRKRTFPLLPGVAVLLTLMIGAATARAAAPMWPVFSPTTWGMRSATNGDVTHFRVRQLHRWGCWHGDIVDLSDRKPAAVDYWQPGSDTSGHQIFLRGPDGSWRMIGTYTRSPNPADVWTMQVHGYTGQPTPYVIVPGRQVNSDTLTEYWLTFAPGKVASWCMRPTAADMPGWGQHVYWRSRFRFHGRAMTAHYEENHGCGAVACQVENWTFKESRPGISRIDVARGGGVPFHLILSRSQPSTPGR